MSDLRSVEYNDDNEFIEEVANRIKECEDQTSDWRQEAKKCYQYRAGHQWDDEDLGEMEEKRKPAVTFNRVEVFVSAVTGLESLNRNEVRYLPRKLGSVQDAMKSDLWNAAAQYVNDDTDADVTHSDAFLDLVTTGMGWSETRMDYETNIDGDVKIEKLHPLYCYWDTRARKDGLGDARWVATVFPMDFDEVQNEWPESADGLLYSKLFEPEFWQTRPHDASTAWQYDDDNTRRHGRPSDEIWVCQYQWYETEKHYRVYFPNRPPEEIPVKAWRRQVKKRPVLEQMVEAGQIRVLGPFPKRKYKRAFLAGWTVLEVQDLVSDDFTIQAMTGKYDVDQNVWYGLVRNLFDPQDWVNALYSEILFILKANAKGGLLAESDAFKNVMNAEQEWAKPDSIVWMNKNAIQQGKVMLKPQSPYPQGLDRLMQFAMQMFSEVSGINLELLGMADRMQPGVLEAQRKQAGMTILAWAFDSLRSYRRRHGRVLARYIQRFLADERLIRISADGMQQYIPLSRDKLALEYDVIVDESPTSPNEKSRVLQILQQILPTMVQMGYEVPPNILDYLPLPQSLIEEWKGAGKEPNPEEEAQKQLAQRGAAAEVQKTEAEAAQKIEDARLKRAKAMTESLEQWTAGEKL